MKNFYSAERNVQIVISLMKQYGIKKVIASPGATNVTFVASIQQDPYFEIYSSVDERSAAYMACGLAVESNEPVAISCTGATASRNYMPALTEAYYRKIPVLAITSLQNHNRIGHNMPQVLDRTVLPNDIAKISVLLRPVKNSEDEWNCNLLTNKALSELFRNGGGPVHINLETEYLQDYSVEVLPVAKKIDRICMGDKFPAIDAEKIAIIVGSHKKWSQKLEDAVDNFCEKTGAVVLCDHTSNYKGKFKFNCVPYFSQQYLKKNCPDLAIHIGDVSGEYALFAANPKNVWRVNPDGEMRDTFKHLSKVFEMSEETFFEHYAKICVAKKADKTTLLDYYKSQTREIFAKVSELPFSNLWIASKMASKIPQGSVVHFAILNSLRTWNFFDLPKGVLCYSNTGGFGIDGCMSSLIGAALANKDKLYFGIIGDLSFFYDMNSLGNKNLGNNIRILLVNNGKGAEFKLFNHLANRFGNDTDKYIAASGHYGNKSTELVKHYATDLGVEYMCASNKDEFEKTYNRFISPKISKPMLLEVFTDSQDESTALKLISEITLSKKSEIYKSVKEMIPRKGIELLKKVLR